MEDRTITDEKVGKFNNLFIENYSLIRFLVQCTLNDSDCLRIDKVTQDIFYDALKMMDSMEQCDDPKNWLIKIAREKIKQHKQ